jgi:hypothetical protein
VGGTKDAPGVTTLAYALGCLWLARGATLLVEADPDGGVLAARLGLPQDPGLTTLAAAGRHEVTPAMLAAHSQSTPLCLALVTAPSSPSQARAALRTVAQRLAGAMAQIGATVVIDLGRLDVESPSLPLAAGADRLLMVTRPTLEGADALAVRLAEQPDLRRRARLVTAGTGPYDGGAIADVLSVACAGHLPYDPAGAASLWAARQGARIPRRPLLRALGTLVATMEEPRTPAPPPASSPAPSSTVPALDGRVGSVPDRLPRCPQREVAAP